MSRLLLGGLALGLLAVGLVVLVGSGSRGSGVESGASRAAGGERSEAGPPGLGRAESASLEAPLAALPAVREAAGARLLGAIVGRVRTANGSSLAAVRVEARREGAVAAVAVADADGSYRLELPEGQSFELQASLAGWRFERRPALPRRSIAGDSVDFVGEPATGLRVRVVDAAGEPLERARLELRPFADIARPVPVDWSPASEFVELEPGGYEIQALVEPRSWPVHGGGELAFEASERSQVLIESGGDSQALELMVGPTRGVFGRVALPAELAANFGPRVGLLPHEAGEPPHPGYFGWKAPLLELGDDTRFAFAVEAPGTYSLGLLGAVRGPALEVFEVEVGDAWVELAPMFPMPAEERYIDVLVRDAGGRVLHDSFRFSLSVVGSGDARGERALQVASKRSDGASRLLLDGPQGEAYWAQEGGYDFRLLVAETMMPILQEPLEPGARSVELQMAATAQLSVQLVGAFREELRSHLGCRISPVASSNYSFGIFNFGEDGRGTASDLPVGEALVRLTWSNPDSSFGRSGRLLLELRHELQPGVNELTIAVPPLHELRVSAPQLNPGALLRLLPQFESLAEPKEVLGEDSTATFAGLLSGTYLLQLVDDPDAGQIVQVPGADVLLDPRASAGLRVVDVEEAGLLPAAGLGPGCRILEVGGGPATARRLSEALSLAGSLEGGRIELLVDCGGGVSAVSVAFAELNGSRRTGGRVVPWID